MIDFETILVDTRGRVGWITLNRPEALNALNAQTMHDVVIAAEQFDADPGIGAIVITGAGRAFAAGADIKEMEDRTGLDMRLGNYFAEWGRLVAVRKPVIAAVNGIAMGGGFELALACDLVIAAENAFFALSEPRVGLSALAGGVQYLPRAIGLPRAMGILLTGRRVPAKEGYELGFVTAVAPAGGAMEEARKWAAQMLECSPLALRATKEVARKTMLGEDFERKLVDAREFPAAKRLRTSNDYVEGPRAFAEKRKPNWTNT